MLVILLIHSWFRGSLVGSGPADPDDEVMIVDEGNNNDSLLLEAEMDVQVDDEDQFVIGIPAPDYNINKSVFYTHYFYKKIQREDGTDVARCNVCWEKKKEIYLKVSEDEDVFYLYFIIFKFRSPMVILRG